MTRRLWTAAELAVLRARYPNEATADVARDLGMDEKRVYAKAHEVGLRKTLERQRAMALRSRLPEVGEATRFRAGRPPANKGLRRPGWHCGRMRETWFKPGETSKRWDPEGYCVGALRITTDGCLMIKVRDGGRGWEMMSRYAWWAETGHWPRRNQVVIHLNGDPHDTRFCNLDLLTRRENMLRNSVHNLPKPLAQLVQLRGALVRKINKRQKETA